jgi:phospholipid/cholesterol/gamma-HCH transport system substrate-binding protein
VKNLGPAIKVSLTFIAASAIGYWAFMMLAKGRCAGEQTDLVLHAYFHDATGLVEKSRVQIAGLNVGHIVGRELNVMPPRAELAREKRFAKISFALQAQRGVVLHSNATVIKRSASLLGEFYLEIDPGSREWVDDKGRRQVSRQLKSGDEIANVSEAVTTDKLIRQVSDVVPVLRNIAEDIRAFTKGPLHDISKNVNDGINENRAAVKAVMHNMEAITSDVRRVTRASGKDVEAIVDDIRHITSGIRTIVGRSDKDVADTTKKLKGGLDKLSAAIDKLDTALGNVSDITGTIKEGKGNIGRLVKDETLVDEVEGVVRDTGGFIRQLTGLQTWIGLRSEYNFLANTIKTYVAIEIRPRPDKYYLIELINDPRGSRHVTQRTTRTDDPAKPLLTREETTEIADAFRFTFQFAKRISLATFRFGIKESTGGIGVDLHLFNDRINLHQDLYDFAANAYPRYKLMASWEFFKRLYLVGGVDDILNSRPQDGSGGGRDYYVGAQLRFNDEDLKSLLLFGGGALGGATKK